MTVVADRMFVEIVQPIVAKGIYVKTAAQYAPAVKYFGEESVVDLVGVVGYYAMIAMLMNVARTAPPKGGMIGLAPLPQYVRPVV
jgi:hypothetical protein